MSQLLRLYQIIMLQLLGPNPHYLIELSILQKQFLVFKHQVIQTLDSFSCFCDSFELVLHHDKIQIKYAPKFTIINIYYTMGTIQGKIKDSFSIKQKPLLKKNYDPGQAPLLNGHIQNSMWPAVTKQGSSKNIRSPERLDYPRKCSDDLELSTDSQIQNLKEYPYCSVGVVMYEVGGHRRYGTGFLIGKNIVLTCAHNLFSLDYGQTASNVCFSPSYGKYKQKQVYKAKQIFFPKEFEKLSLKGNELYQENFCRNDYGIIKLQENVNLQHSYGYLGYNFASQQHSLISDKTIMGFTHLQNKLITLYSFVGKVKFTDQIITYPFPTEIGMSGGPILEIVNGDFIVIGIHTFFKGRGKGGNGQGVRLNQQKLDQINSWLQVYEEVIDLRDKSLGKEGVKQLVRQQKYTFDVINLSKNCLQKDGLKHFSRVQWPNLYHLDLGGNNIGNQGIQYLILTPIRNLAVLNLWGNKIGKKGIQVLVRGQWPKLQNLNLYNNQIGNDGLQILVVQDWKLLNTINLGENLLGVQAIQQLKNCKWKNIVCLNLWGNSNINDKKTVQSLHNYFPKMKYLYL